LQRKDFQPVHGANHNFIELGVKDEPQPPVTEIDYKIPQRPRLFSNEKTV
jgi:hypothetical protein